MLFLQKVTNGEHGGKRGIRKRGSKAGWPTRWRQGAAEATTRCHRFPRIVRHSCDGPSEDGLGPMSLIQT
jgi:hypothetical protein